MVYRCKPFDGAATRLWCTMRNYIMSRRYGGGGGDECRSSDDGGVVVGRSHEPPVCSRVVFIIIIINVRTYFARRLIITIVVSIINHVKWEICRKNKIRTIIIIVTDQTLCGPPTDGLTQRLLIHHFHCPIPPFCPVVNKSSAAADSYQLYNVHAIGHDGMHRFTAEM